MSKTQAEKALRAMLVDDDTNRAAAVKASLLSSGIEVPSIVSSTSGLLLQIEQHRPDVVLIALTRSGWDIFESLAVVNDRNPTPVVMFSQEDDPEYIQQAVQSGVSTYLLEGINPDKIRPVIDLAMAQFSSHQALRLELDSARDRLRTYSLVARAKTLLMQQKQLSEEVAHRLLTRTAMENNVTLQEMARTVITALDTTQD